MHPRLAHFLKRAAGLGTACSLAILAPIRAGDGLPPGSTATDGRQVAIFAQAEGKVTPVKVAGTFDPTSRYETRQIEGWTVLVNQDLLTKEPELADQTLTLLRIQLYHVLRTLPKPVHAPLQSIKIWVEADEGHHPCMAYHPGEDWLREHGMNPQKVRSVEIANARNFLTWTKDQPWMVLHELAHGYHHLFLKEGYDNAELKAAFLHAQESKSYEAVLRINGRDDRAYALTNPMEYFAEGTEAYFGTNDFFPYVRSELQRHDPELFRLMKTLWKVD